MRPQQQRSRAPRLDLELTGAELEIVDGRDGEKRLVIGPLALYVHVPLDPQAAEIVARGLSSDGPMIWTPPAAGQLLVASER